MSDTSPISGLFAEFRSPETERRFSQQFIRQHQQTLAIACRIAAIIYLFALWPDYQFYGLSNELIKLGVTRAVLATGFLVLSFVVVRYDTSYYRNVFVLQILMGLCVAAVEAVRNGADGAQLATGIFIFCIYLLAFNRLVLSAIAGIMFAIFNALSITFLQPEVELVIRHILMLVGANIFGFLFWRQFHLLRRREFLTLDLIHERQEELNAEINLRHQVEHDLRKALEVATKVDASKSKMIATVSHDLRSPLSAIIGFADISGEETKDLLTALEKRESSQTEFRLVKDITESLLHISKSGRHMADVINNLLTATKLEFDDSEIFEVEISVHDLLEIPCSVAQQLADQAGITLHISSNESPPCLWIDVGRVRQILINLLANAIKFTPEGGRVSLAVSLMKDGNVAFRITDNGIGIAASEIENIFSPFAHKQGGGLHGEASTDLGLGLSRTLAEHHGGSIDVESTLGEGTVFTLVLPASRVR